jgi:hypothetical protein
MAKRRRRTRALIGVLVVLVLAGVAGTIFYLDFHEARTNAEDKKVDRAKEKAAAGFQLAGHVSAVDAASVTVKLAGGQLRRVVTVPQTRILNATAGTLDDVKKGRRALVRTVPRGPRRVQEIVVLPATSRLGLVIAGTGFGMVWSISSDGRIGPRLNMLDAVVSMARSAPRTDVVVGATVIVRAQRTVAKPVRTIATDIAVVPSTSVFVS